MKLKHLFYSTITLWEYYQFFTMKGWLKFKDRILLKRRFQPHILSRYGIKLQLKHRYFRSIVTNKVNLLGSKDYEFLITRSYMQKTRKRIYSRAQAFQQLQERRQRFYKIIEGINVGKKNRV